LIAILPIDGIMICSSGSIKYSPNVKTKASALSGDLSPRFLLLRSLLQPCTAIMGNIFIITQDEAKEAQMKIS
jgi:hypothetical protein